MYLNGIGNDIAVVAREKLNGFGDHWGVYLPNGLVVHNTVEKNVQTVSFQEFSAGKPIKIIRTVSSSEAFNVYKRINHEMQNPKKYDLLVNNCEIFANRITGWKTESPQVKSWAFLSILGVFLLAMNT